MEKRIVEQLANLTRKSWGFDETESFWKEKAKNTILDIKRVFPDLVIYNFVDYDWNANGERFFTIESNMGKVYISLINEEGEWKYILEK